jgi:hypothetical protein
MREALTSLQVGLVDLVWHAIASPKRLLNLIGLVDHILHIVVNRLYHNQQPKLSSEEHNKGRNQGKARETNLNLVDVDPLVLLLHLLVRGLHRIHSGHLHIPHV